MGGRDLCRPHASVVPQIFNAVADSLNWCPLCLALLGRFHHSGTPPPPPPLRGVPAGPQWLYSVCGKLGVPMAPHKRDGPTTCITFLGIQVNTVAGKLRLPEEKLLRLKTLLQEWEAKKVCQRKQLESLIGLLTHACKVVRPGVPSSAGYLIFSTPPTQGWTGRAC